ncbi:MAG: peptidoglycan-binding protein [Clostridia bacterium]|nr:peptidoglycan-binding protein [Clostridia bacterium]
MPNQPRIPENIVVHLGAPDADVQNVTVGFADYIKNVASSEIYPTWPEEAIKANVLAQISVALNRVYTEYYRSFGRNFDITSSPAYDQTYVYQRDIFDNVSEIVDGIFDSYIRRMGSVEPLFAQFCDGVEVQCEGLRQWDSVRLAEEGLSYEEILRRFYGNDIEIVRNVPVENITESAPLLPLSEGDSGREVELIQTKLNRISANYPGIPKIFPVDGFFDTSTTNAVRKFQEVFGLTVDGIVGRATWYRINLAYNGVKQLSAITSEGLTVEELDTRYPGVLRVGASGPEVTAVQYYLAYISLFYNGVTSPMVDGDFGAGTEEAVKSYQRTFGLTESGEIDLLTWDSIENTYYGILENIPYEFESGIILPFPGRVLRTGVDGNDVRALQEYLNYISNTYPNIPRVNVDGDFGPSTAAAVRAFKEEFNLPGNPERVDAATWNAIINVYDDLYFGNIVRPDQFPGYEIS